MPGPGAKTVWVFMIFRWRPCGRIDSASPKTIPPLGSENAAMKRQREAAAGVPSRTTAATPVIVRSNGRISASKLQAYGTLYVNEKRTQAVEECKPIGGTAANEC